MLTSRAFAGEADIPAVLELRRSIAAYYPFSPEITEAELRAEYLDRFAEFELFTRLWFLDGVLAGFGELRAPVERHSEPILYLRPRIRPESDMDTIGTAMIAWAEGIALDRCGPGVRVEATIRREMTGTARLLESIGYRQDRVFVRMRRDLNAPITDSALPPGYSVRSLAGIDEVEAWTALFNTTFEDHYDFRPWVSQSRIQEMGYPWHVPELDLIAEALDGTLAGFCWTIRQGSNEGALSWHLSLVGTAREHRRRGLASALIALTVDRLIELGGGSLELSVDATSETGANRLYERLGFEEVSALIDYRRKID